MLLGGGLRIPGDEFMDVGLGVIVGVWTERPAFHWRVFHSSIRRATPIASNGVLDCLTFTSNQISSLVLL